MLISQWEERPQRATTVGGCSSQNNIYKLNHCVFPKHNFFSMTDITANIINIQTDSKDAPH